MGYFSNIAIDKEEQATYEDHSYPSPEMQLQWRIEDLFNRLEELHHGRYNQETVDYSDCRLSRTDIEYALPEHLSNVDDTHEFYPHYSLECLSGTIHLLYFCGSFPFDIEVLYFVNLLIC